MSLELYVAFLAFVFGACAGSFLNVCIYRIPRDLSVVRPRSFCPACGDVIRWYDNIPLLSFLLLRARCRRCGCGISPRYVTVELITAVLFLLVWLKYSPLAAPVPGIIPAPDWGLVPVYWLAVGGLILGAFADFEHLIIPDRVTWGGIAAGLLLSPLVPALHGAVSPLGALKQSAFSAALGFGILWVVAIGGKMVFRKDAMGFGDVKLLGAVGAFLGWRAVLFTIMASSLIGSIVGIMLVATGRKHLQSRIPYGPYLALGALIWILWGVDLWRFYMNWLIGPVY